MKKSPKIPPPDVGIMVTKDHKRSEPGKPWFYITLVSMVDGKPTVLEHLPHQKYGAQGRVDDYRDWLGRYIRNGELPTLDDVRGGIDES